VGGVCLENGWLLTGHNHASAATSTSGAVFSCTSTLPLYCSYTILQCVLPLCNRGVSITLHNNCFPVQGKPTTREWDLNRPDAKKLDVPARLGDDDPRCGPSSLQRFAGEDLTVRQTLQLACRTPWCAGTQDAMVCCNAGCHGVLACVHLGVLACEMSWCAGMRAPSDDACHHDHFVLACNGWGVPRRKAACTCRYQGIQGKKAWSAQL
jgi:hypothetical protein